MLLKITIDPDPGYAVKEVFYTYQPVDNNLYALFPIYPSNRKLVLKDMTLRIGTDVSLLTTRETVNWKQVGANVEIELPPFDPGKIKNTSAYVIKIAGFGKFASKTSIEINYQPGSFNPTVTMMTKENDLIRYTLDGSEPTDNSTAYTGAVTLDKSAMIRAKSFTKGSLPGATVSRQASVYQWMNAMKISSPKLGIAYRYFDPPARTTCRRLMFHSLLRLALLRKYPIK